MLPMFRFMNRDVLWLTAIVGDIVVLAIERTLADEPQLVVRPISEADSVLAVYCGSLGLGAVNKVPLIFVAWPDGYVVWSADRLKGGPPYRAARVDPKQVTALLARFDKDGLFADEKLSQEHVGPGGSYTTVLIKSGKKRLEMVSWHELFEASGDLVAHHNGVSALLGGRRLEVLRKSPADYLYYRWVWSETRGKLTDLIPDESSVSVGVPVMKAGELSWQEPVTMPKQDEGKPNP
jgi:hypothetical protein